MATLRREPEALWYKEQYDKQKERIDTITNKKDDALQEYNDVIDTWTPAYQTIYRDYYTKWITRQYDAQLDGLRFHFEAVMDGAARCAVARLYYGIARHGSITKEQSDEVLNLALASGSTTADLTDATGAVHGFLVNAIEVVENDDAGWPVPSNADTESMLNFLRSLPTVSGILRDLSGMIPRIKNSPYDLYESDTYLKVRVKDEMTRGAVRANALASTFRTELTRIKDAAEGFVTAFVAAQSADEAT